MTLILKKKQKWIELSEISVTAMDSDRNVSVCCVLDTDKVQTLVDFNEVPAVEILPSVCQLDPEDPCWTKNPSPNDDKYVVVCPCSSFAIIIYHARL